jgi:hypothetical protein
LCTSVAFMMHVFKALTTKHTQVTQRRTKNG